MVMKNGASFSHVAGDLLRACDALELKLEKEGKYLVDLIDSSKELDFLRHQAVESLQEIFLTMLKGNDDYFSDQEIEIYARLLSLKDEGKKNVSLDEAGTQLLDDLVAKKKPSVNVEHFFPNFLRVAMTHEETSRVEEFLDHYLLTLKFMTDTDLLNASEEVKLAMAQIVFGIMQNHILRTHARPELAENSVYMEFNDPDETAETFREKDEEDVGIVANYSRVGLDVFTIKKKKTEEIIFDLEWRGSFLKKAKKYEKLPDPWVDTSPTALDRIMALVGHNQVKEFAQKVIRLEKGNIKSLKQRFMAKASDGSVNEQLGSSGHHMVLMGNPGTGKTTVANLLGKLFKEAGILNKGHVVSVSAKDLIAGYVGQTAIKTGKLLEKAKDGVLFIDEAYKLFDGNGAEFASESVAELIVAMENQRSDLVVVFAGYPEPMKRLLKSNEGIPRRIKHYVTCEDYSVPDLMKIRDSLLNIDGHVMEDGAAQLFEKITKENKEVVEAKYWGNGGFVRDYLQNIIQAQEDRLEITGAMANLNPDKKNNHDKIRTILSTLTADDVRKASVPVPAFLKGEMKRPIGFAPWPEDKQKTESHGQDKKDADVVPMKEGKTCGKPANDRRVLRKVAAQTLKPV